MSADEILDRIGRGEGTVADVEALDAMDFFGTPPQQVEERWEEDYFYNLKNPPCVGRQ